MLFLSYRQAEKLFISSISTPQTRKEVQMLFLTYQPDKQAPVSTTKGKATLQIEKLKLIL